jgi:hypothetical protein
METGAETNADTKMQRGSQPVLWQFRNSHIPKRKNTSFKQRIIKKELK